MSRSTLSVCIVCVSSKYTTLSSETHQPLLTTGLRFLGRHLDKLVLELDGVGEASSVKRNESVLAASELAAKGSFKGERNCPAGTSIRFLAGMSCSLPEIISRTQ